MLSRASEALFSGDRGVEGGELDQRTWPRAVPNIVPVDA